MTISLLERLENTGMVVYDPSQSTAMAWSDSNKHSLPVTWTVKKELWTLGFYHSVELLNECEKGLNIIY